LQALPTSGVTATPDPISTLLTLAVPGVSWTPDQWKGKFVVGPSWGDCAVIAGNTANTLYVTIGAFFTADSLKALVIADCGATLSNAIPDNLYDTVLAAYVKADITFSGIRFSRGFNITACDRVDLFMCDIEGPRLTSTRNVEITSSRLHGMSPVSAPVFDLDSILIANSQLSELTFGGADWFSCILETSVIDKCNWPGGPSYSATACQFVNLGVVVSRGTAASFLSCRFDNAPANAGANSLGSGLLVDGGAVSVAISGGAGNAGYGLEVRNQGQVSWDGGKLSGAKGDLKCGGNPVRSWDDFVGKAPRNHELDLYGQLCRVASSNPSTTDPISPAAFPFPQFASDKRPAPASVGAGYAIYNTTTTSLNISDGTAWRDAAGNKL
jgi:hypothetical protein